MRELGFERKIEKGFSTKKMIICVACEHWDSPKRKAFVVFSTNSISLFLSLLLLTGLFSALLPSPPLSTTLHSSSPPLFGVLFGFLFTKFFSSSFPFFFP